MWIDQTWFGYGVGCLLFPWIIGMICGSAYNCIARALAP